MYRGNEGNVDVPLRSHLATIAYPIKSFATNAMITCDPTKTSRASQPNASCVTALRRHVPIALVLVCVSCLAIVSGCQRFQRQPLRRSPPIQIPVRDFAAVQDNGFARIAILRLENATRTEKLEPMVRTALAAAMRSGCPGEVVDIGDQVNQACELDAVLRNGYPLQLLAETWRGFQADGVIFARIDDFNPYQPMSMGITMHLVDTRNASLIRSLNHHWSLSDERTRRDYSRWLKQRFPEAESIDLYLASPSVFVEFIMQRIAAQFRL